MPKRKTKKLTKKRHYKKRGKSKTVKKTSSGGTVNTRWVDEVEPKSQKKSIFEYFEALNPLKKKHTTFKNTKIGDIDKEQTKNNNTVDSLIQYIESPMVGRTVDDKEKQQIKEFVKQENLQFGPELISAVPTAPWTNTSTAI